MNWNQLATPPDTRSYHISIGLIQADYYFGITAENDFIGLMNIFFDLAWEDEHEIQAAQKTNT